MAHTTARRTREAAARVVLFLIMTAAPGCATFVPVSPEAVAAARVLPSYSAALKVTLSGPTRRGRTRALVAFARPGALRVEIPGPGGVRVLAVANGGHLWSVFPAERAYFEGRADAAAMQALLGIALEPEAMMDVLAGAGSDQVREYRADYRAGLPRRLSATLSDGSRLRVTVEDVQAPVTLPAAAFQAPAHPGYRRLDAEEVVDLWARP